MHFEASRTFVKLYRKLPSEIKERVDRTLEIMEKDLSHPSLSHKKMANYNDIWEARVTQSYRITYQKVDRMGYLRKVGTHDLLRRP